MNGTYVLLEANCQTLANLLAQRIAFGSDPMVPYQTISHYLGGRLSRNSLFALNEFDHVGSTRLKSITLRETRNPTRNSSEGGFMVAAEPSSGNEVGNAATSGTSDDGLIDLDEGNRPYGPLHVSEVRSNARFWSRDSTSPGPKLEQPPPFSLPEGYLEWAKSRKDCSIPERFPGPDSPYIKFVKDDIHGSFSRMVEYQRNVRSREEEMKLWLNPEIPEEKRAKVMAELASKETAFLRKRNAAIKAYMKTMTDNQEPKDYQIYEDGSPEADWYTEEN